MAKIFVTSYGDKKYKLARERICKQAKEFGVFEDIFVHTENNIPRTSIRDFLWKPYVIKTSLDKMSDGDILLYIDAGCHINPQGRARFDEYVNMLTDDNPFMVFHINYTEKRWTKKEVFTFFQISHDDPFILTNQIMATVFLVKKNGKSMEIINRWYDLSKNNPNLFHFYEFGTQLPGFWNHRHDQSILSILLKQKGVISIPDETYFFPDWEMGRDFPFHAKRSKV